MTPRLIDTERYFGWTVDFTKPVGEPAFSRPDSVSWRVFKNPVVLAIGGICAVLLEFADARIRSGVWDHSTFRTDPVGRSKRTGLAAMIGVYGPQSVARRVIQGVTNLHARVQGETPNGESYQALDPDLMDWVSATAHYGFLTAYHRFAEPLSDADQMRYFRDGGAIADLYGVQHPLLSWADFDVQLQSRMDRFEPHAIVHEFLEIMASGRAAPQIPKRFHKALVRAAVDIVPAPVREQLQIGSEYDLSWRAETAVNAMVGVAERLPDLTSPAAQASERLGLPRSFLWRSPPTQTRMLAQNRLAARPAGMRQGRRPW